jgi:hypothetical protein
VAGILWLIHRAQQRPPRFIRVPLAFADGPAFKKHLLIAHEHAFKGSKKDPVKGTSQKVRFSALLISNALGNEAICRPHSISRKIDYAFAP